MLAIQSAVEILIPISLFFMIAVIVIVPRYFQSIERQKMADTVRLAIEKGQPLPPEIIQALTVGDRERARPRADLRRGVTLLAIAFGMVALGLVIGQREHEALHPLLGVAAFPGFIGIALIAMHLLEKPRT